jgi:LmbE family N-acetylglucosaminyl deacetylase
MFGRLLAIFAHPDDESYGPAGTLREAAEAPGGVVRVITATRGEAGSLGISKYYPPAELARIRGLELAAATEILEIDSVVLGWADKGVAAVDPEVGIATLAAEIRLFRPDTLLTFHPNGLSGHSDHVAITALATRAAMAAADPAFASRFGAPWRTRDHWHYAIPESKGKILRPLRNLFTVPDADVERVVDVRRHLPRKHAACRAQVTQTDFYRQLQQVNGGLDEYWSQEHLVRAKSGDPVLTTPAS